MEAQELRLGAYFCACYSSITNVVPFAEREGSRAQPCRAVRVTKGDDVCDAAVTGTEIGPQPKFLCFHPLSLLTVPGFSHSMDVSLNKLREWATDREAWHVAVHGVAKNWTRLSD